MWLCHPMLPDDIGSEIDDVLVVKAEKHTLCHDLASLIGTNVQANGRQRLAVGSPVE